MRARKPLRLGSYSRRCTSPDMSRLARLKSTVRRRCLWPPPRRRTVMRPWLLRPAFSRLPSVSALIGLPFHSSRRSTMISWRWPGVVGLKVLSAIRSDPCRHVDLLPLGEGDDRFLVVGTLAELAAKALGLALDADGVDGRDLDLEQPL